MKTKVKSTGQGGRKRAPLPGDDKPALAARRRGQKQKGRKPGTTNRKFGLPVKEAERDMVIPLLAVDLAKAAVDKPDDVNSEDNFLSCVIAQAVTRACGAERVWIGRRTAFVAFPGEKCARRYRIEDKSRLVLEAWDRGEDIEEGVELRLKAPSKANTLSAMRRASRAFKERNPELRSDSSKRKTKRKQRRSDPLHNIVRNGNLVRWS